MAFHWFESQLTRCLSRITGVQQSYASRRRKKTSKDFAERTSSQTLSAITKHLFNTNFFIDKQWRDCNQRGRWGYYNATFRSLQGTRMVNTVPNIILPLFNSKTFMECNPRKLADVFRFMNVNKEVQDTWLFCFFTNVLCSANRTWHKGKAIVLVKSGYLFNCWDLV